MRIIKTKTYEEMSAIAAGIIGGQVGIAGHIVIPDNTTIGAQAGVIGSIRKSGEVLLGSPAIPIKNYMRSYAVFKQQGKE